MGGPQVVLSGEGTGVAHPIVDPTGVPLVAGPETGRHEVGGLRSMVDTTIFKH